MSGILAALQAVGQLFGGYGQVTIGPVVLASMEVPDRIPLGGSHMLAIHKLPGGARVVDAMGRDDLDIGWSGVMQGLGAESRMHTLDSLRQSGTPLQLAFGTSSFTVIVHRFAADYQRANWIPYTIGCAVVQDNAAQFGAAPPSLLGSLNADLSDALGFDVTAATSAAITVAQKAVNVAGALGVGGSAFASATAALGDAQTALAIEQGASTGTITGIIGAAATAGNILGVTQISEASGAFGSALGAAGDLANTVTGGAYLSRAAINHANAGS